MKRTTDKLLDDLLADSVPPDFRAALMDKTLQSARRRKQARRFNMGLGAAVLAGMFLFSFWKRREPAALTAQTRQPDAMIVHSQPLQPAQVVATKFGPVAEFVSSATPCAEVLTSSSSGPYQEIDDHRPALGNFGAKNTTRFTSPRRVTQTSMLKRQGDGRFLSLMAFRPVKLRLVSHRNIRHSQFTEHQGNPWRKERGKSKFIPGAKPGKSGPLMTDGWTPILS
jgi:hypothetical protein